MNHFRWSTLVPLFVAPIFLISTMHGESPAVSSDILNDASSDQQVPATSDAQPPPGAQQAPGTADPRVILPPAAYAPYSVGQKFAAATRNVVGIYALVGVGVSAGYSQLVNTPGEWGQGGEAYAKRYASAFGTNMSYQYFNAILDSSLHEDPRYFPSVDRSAKARLRHAIARGFLTRKDNGTDGLAYSRWASAIGAGFLTTSWQPRSNSHPSDAFQTAGAILGLDLAIRVGQEFIPFLRHLNP